VTVNLQDPASGRLVRIKVAHLEQRCRVCKAQLKGRDIVDVEGDKAGWTCLEHLGLRLSLASMTPETRARLEARRDLAGAQPGETITVSRTLLTALGAF
jgi:hypothetical protein